MLVVVGTAASAVLLRDDSPGFRCAVSVTAGEARPELVARDQLLPAGSVGAERRRTVEAIEGIGGPVGSVVTGRFYPRLVDRPSVLAYGERLALVTAPGPDRASVEAVDPDTTGTDWRVDLTGTWTTFTGGPVGEDLVLAFSGATPRLVTLAEQSFPLHCARLAARGATVRTDQAGADVVVAAVSSGPTTDRVVRRLDPVTGRTRWSADGVGPLASVTVAGDLVLLARADSTTLATEGFPRPSGPWVQALRLSDGSPAWQSRDALALLAAGGDGSSYLLGRGGRLVSLDDTGRERWSRRVPEGFRAAWLWGDRLVLRGPDPRGGPMLRAFDATSGEPVWEVRARQAPGVGDAPRTGFGPPLVEDGTAWVPAPNGVLEVDVQTGHATRHDSIAPVDQLLRVGDRDQQRVVVLSGPAVLVTR